MKYIMFSPNPFYQQIPSSSHVFPPSSFFDLEKDNVLLNEHNYYSQCVTGDSFSHAPPPVVTDNITVRKQQQLYKESRFQYFDDNSQLLESVIYHTKKKVVNNKKDGHSKIHTAQGPRDRRVRLSIEVAEKFFCLQDFLGFDKASKTLDWLFTMSETSIRDLVEEMKHCSSSSVTDQCEVVFQEIFKRGSDEKDKHHKKKSAPKFLDGKRNKITRKHIFGVHVNQSRAEARARARERTQEKLHNKKHDHELKKVPDDCYHPVNPPNGTNHSTFWSQVESQNDYGEKATKSILEPKVSMPSTVLYGYQHNKYTSFLNLQ